MQRYLTQLINDLETATRHAPDATTYRFVSRWRDDDDDDGGDVLQSRYVRLCDMFGLVPDAFPPVERLTKTQVTSLLTAIENLWRAWHISWDCPNRLTARRRYTEMVERMTAEKVRYSYDLGADIDFCDRRSEGKCPFGEGGTCVCQEVEDAAKHDAELWESSRHGYEDFDNQSDRPSDPLAPVRNWLYGDDVEYAPWEQDEDRERWQKFVVEEDVLAWLYFYQPQRDAADEPEVRPEDFEDFEWGSSTEEDFDLPF